MMSGSIRSRRSLLALHREWSRSRHFLSSKSAKKASLLPPDGLSLDDFLTSRRPPPLPPRPSSLSHTSTALQFHIRTFGCQMNVNDSEIVRSLLLEAGCVETQSETSADVLLTNTCAIREGAEQKVWHRLRELRGRQRNSGQKQLIGVLGCMAERLQTDLLENGLADLVVGPDAYRDLPRLIQDLTETEQQTAVSVQLSLEETYAEIRPVRQHDDVSAFVSIQRGCSNRCSFCIVPFTRGQERSRPLASVLDEVSRLVDEGVQEVTLLGHNVNSYHDTSQAALEQSDPSVYSLSNDGFRSRQKRRHDGGYFFADLLDQVSLISPEVRVRFTSPHPKDYPEPLLELMADRPNICNQLHMPAQSGSSSTLKRMKRGYTREAYLDLIDTVRSKIPDVALSSDFIAGFCDETEEEHAETLSLLEQVRYDQAFLFAYSMRGKTHAHRTMSDNVEEEVKQRRLRELIDTYQFHVHAKNSELEIGRLRLVLIEGAAKKQRQAELMWTGRTDQNKRILFPVASARAQCLADENLVSLIRHSVDVNHDGLALKRHFASVIDDAPLVDVVPGDYAVVEVAEAKGHTLRGRLLWRTTLEEFHRSGLAGMDMVSQNRAATVASILSDALERESVATDVVV